MKLRTFHNFCVLSAQHEFFSTNFGTRFVYFFSAGMNFQQFWTKYSKIGQKNPHKVLNSLINFTINNHEELMNWSLCLLVTVNSELNQFIILWQFFLPKFDIFDIRFTGWHLYWSIIKCLRQNWNWNWYNLVEECAYIRNTPVSYPNVCFMKHVMNQIKQNKMAWWFFMLALPIIWFIWWLTTCRR